MWGPNWWPVPWPPYLLKAVTAPGLTCAQVPAVRRPFWELLVPSGGFIWWRMNQRRTARSLLSSPMRPLPEETYTVLTGDGRSITATLAREAAKLPGSMGPDTLFDRVMVDAPCSGLGALRRRPEARWRKTPRDIADLLPLQGQLLDAAIEVTRPGGVIAYVTCSPHAAETQNIVAEALESGKVHLLDARAAPAGGGPARIGG